MPKRFFIPFSLIFSLAIYGSINSTNTIILSSVIMVNYFFSFLLTQNRFRQIILFMGIFSNVSALLLIKYFFREELIWNNQNEISIKLLFAMGSSFYIVQAIGYLIDVYYEKEQFQKNFMKIGLYISFFPQLVMGPIERSYNLIKQFEMREKAELEEIKEGLSRIFLGLVKKLVIADNLYLLIGPFLNNYSEYDVITNFFSIQLFFFILYADFSGYTDIAIGTAKLVGIKLTENFNNPLFSDGIHDFMKRWNITLYTWFKDYLVLPLQKNKYLRSRFYTFFFISIFSALWHQVSMTFLFWGLYLFFSFSLEWFLVKKLHFGKLTIKILFFFALVPSFVLFLANSLTSASDFFLSFLNIRNWHTNSALLNNIYLLHIVIFIIYILILFMEKKNIRDFRNILPENIVVRNMVYIFLMFAFTLLSTDSSYVHTYSRF